MAVQNDREELPSMSRLGKYATVAHTFFESEHGYSDGFKVHKRAWAWTTAADRLHVLAQDSKRFGSFHLCRSPRIVLSAEDDMPTVRRGTKLSACYRFCRL